VKRLGGRTLAQWKTVNYYALLSMFLFYNFFAMNDKSNKNPQSLSEASDVPSSVGMDVENINRDTIFKDIQKAIKDEVDIISQLQMYPKEFHFVIVEELIKADKGRSVAMDLEKFEEADRKEIVLMLIRSDHKQIALMLIMAGDSHLFFENLENFQVDHREIALESIEEGEGLVVVRNLEKLQVNHKEIALKFIEVGQFQLLIENLDIFQLNEQDCEEIITKQQEYVWRK
jgi:hypothetical protein